MSDDFDGALRHVAAGTVIGPSQPLGSRQPAARKIMACEAARAIVGCGFGRPRHGVNLVTCQTAQSPVARAIAPAQLHREMVLQQIGLARSVALERNAQDGKRVAQGRTRTKIKIVFAGPQHSGVTPLVAIHADVFSQARRKLRRIDDRAIRAFPGRGVLIWGARTLDGNSQDWRYINVRRTIIMLEQSIKYATLAYVFEPNVASTWVTIKNMIANFLTNQWKAGALAGAKPEEAFSVDVGLGSTMTGDDILNGLMNVMVKVALVRPAEFIVITFQQKMQTS